MERRGGHDRGQLGDEVVDQPLALGLRAELDQRPLLLVPHLDDDIHDIDGLLQMRRYLFASESELEQLIADVVA